MVSVFAAIACLIVPAFALSQPENRSAWQFAQTAAVQVPLSERTHPQLKPGIGFDVQLSYRFMAHWHGFVSAGWNDFRNKTIGIDGTASTGLGEIQCGMRFEMPLHEKFHWFVSGAGGSAKNEFYSEPGHSTRRPVRVQGYSGAAGISTEIVEGLELGVFGRFSRYILSKNLREAAAPIPVERLATGISLRWQLR